MKTHVPLVLAIILAATFSSPMAAQQSQAAKSGDMHVGLPVDWSFRHVVSSTAITTDFERAAKQEPRVLYNTLTRIPKSTANAAGPSSKAPHIGKSKAAPGSRAAIDWNFTLGPGSVAPNMSPAKYTFDANANPTCVDSVGTLADFVVYGLNVAASVPQPNLVAFKQLYVNPGGTGFCGAGLTKPVVKFAYGINTIGGSILTSPILSLDGKKVAFIESSATGSKFHVLTIGTNGSNGTFNVVTNQYAAVTPGTSGDNGSIVSVSIPNNVTLSSPWVDYQSDAGYFGDDAGNMYKTTCVFFCVGSPAIVAGWPVSVAATTILTAPTLVTDASNAQSIFVGAASGTGKGNLYKLTLASCPGLSCVTSPLLPAGFNSTNGGIVDAPIVDSTFQTVFVMAGNNIALTGTGVAKEYKTDLTLLATLAFSKAAYDIFSPAFTDTYFANTLNQATAPTGNMIACAPFNPSGQPGLFVISFTKAAGNLTAANPPVMNTTAAASTNLGGSVHVPCTPITEIKNGASDRVFFSQTNPAQVSSYVVSPDNASPTLPLTAAETGGTSAIVVDNTANTTTFPEASSIYFSTLGTSATCATGTGGTLANGNCAVKLTQSALQ